MNLLDVVNYMREGSKTTSPIAGTYRRFRGCSETIDSTCAIGAAVEGMAKATHKWGPDCQTEILSLLGFSQDEGESDSVVLGFVVVHDPSYYVMGTPMSLMRWTTLLNDTILKCDPTCDPRPFIADCLEAWASQS